MHPAPPASLGRGIVLDDGAPAPAHWSSSDRVVIDAAVLAAPSKTIARLAVAWAERTPLVIEFQVPVETLRTTEVNHDEPYTLPASFEFAKERLQFLVWANNYDGRNEGTPVWWHARKAERLGAGPGLTTDVVLPDGRAAWCDGGPRGPVDVDDLIVHRESIEMGSLNTSPARPRSAAQGARDRPDRRRQPCCRTGENHCSGRIGQDEDIDCPTYPPGSRSLGRA